MTNAAFQIRLPPSGPVAKEMTPGYVLTVQSDGTHVAAAPGGGGGGAVSSVFGRTGAVVAVAGDYGTTKITNQSSVAGVTLTDALNNLGSGLAPVTSVFTRTGNISANNGDYTSSQITSQSVVAFGGTVTTALNILSTGVQITVASVADLAAHDSGGNTDATLAQVAGFDVFMLDLSPPAGAVADGVNLIDALNNAGALWCRLYETPASNQYLADIFVNGSTGNDGSGAPDNAGTPLKTLQEAFNRIARLGLIAQSITIHYTGTAQSFDADLTAVVAAGSSIVITVVGALTTLATQTASSFTAPDPTGNTRGALTFPAAGYAAGEPLVFGGDRLGWVTALASADVDNTTNFFALDGTLHNPTGGSSVSHVAFASSIGNVSARLPAGVQIVITNVTQTGQQVCSGPPLGLVFDQCKCTSGAVPTGPVSFVNCLCNGLDAFQNAGAPTVAPGDPVFQQCAFYGNMNVRGGQNVVLLGSTTVFSPGKLILEDGTITCEISAGLADWSFWGLSSVDAPITLNDGAHMDLQFCTVWGASSGVNTSFRMNPGAWVGVQSTNLPTITGGTALGFLGSRGFTAAQLPVVAPLLPGGFYFQDATSGTSGNTFDLRNQVANISPTNLFATTPRRGVYDVICYAAIHGTGTAGNVVVNVTWFDPSTFTQTVAAVTLTNIATSQHGVGAVVPILTDGSNIPTFSVTGITTAGALSYDLSVVVEKKSSGP